MINIKINSKIATTAPTLATAFLVACGSKPPTPETKTVFLPAGLAVAGSECSAFLGTDPDRIQLALANNGKMPAGCMEAPNDPDYVSLKHVGPLRVDRDLVKLLDIHQFVQNNPTNPEVQACADQVDSDPVNGGGSMDQLGLARASLGCIQLYCEMGGGRVPTYHEFRYYAGSWGIRSTEHIPQMVLGDKGEAMVVGVSEYVFGVSKSKTQQRVPFRCVEDVK
jgi:hypothetical protein